MGRKKTDYTEFIRITTRPESVRALDLLSESTGLSRAHLARLAIDKYLIDLGLLAPVDLVPTRTCMTNTKRGATA